MGFLEEFLRDVGALWDRTHIVSFTKDSAAGIFPRFTRDLHPLPETGLTGGHLLELYAVFDHRHTIDANSHLRFDVLEEDWLFTGGVDDMVTSLLGTGAAPPPVAGPTRQLATQVHSLPAGRTLAWFVEEYKRTFPAYEDTILVVRENPTNTKPGDRRTHVIAWFRLEHQADDIGEHSEFYFVVDLNDTVHAASPVIELVAAPAGVSVRVTGIVNDLTPFVVGSPEPLEGVPVALGDRRAVTGEDGSFTIDARLPVGNHVLRFARSGIDTLELPVEVVADPAGKVTVTIRSPTAAVLGTVTTTQPATEASLVSLALAAPIGVKVHKLRGTVVWPDSRPGNVAANYHGTPLAERRVYVLPLPAGAEVRKHRPKTTRDWEALKDRPNVLRSTRLGRPQQRERTDLDGRFEVKYVDYSAGSSFLIWSERLTTGDGGVNVEAPDYVVRTFQRQLIELHPPDVGGNPDLVTTGNAGVVRVLNRNVVDYEINLWTADTVAWGVDALRVGGFPAPDGRTLVRPRRDYARPDGLREMRDRFDAAAALVAGADEELAVPESRVVDGLRLEVLPLVPVHESPDSQGGAARRARAALATAGAAVFPDYNDTPFPAPVPLAAKARLGGFDVGAVTLALDAERIANAVSMANAAWPGGDEAKNPARVVKLLESTFVVRPQLGVGKRLRVDQARWHIDAFSLADSAFVSVPAGGNPVVADRQLDRTVVPVLNAVSPRLSAVGARRIYLAPGHGLWPAVGHQASVAPARWGSKRGGYGLNAGEDESDALIASHGRWIALLNGGLVETCRELDDFTIAGVGNTANGVFVRVPDPDFPRLWQQNPVYFFGANADAVVMAPPPGPPADPNAFANWPNPAGGKNGHGIEVRSEHMRTRARAGDAISLVFAIHTNATDLHDRRGTQVEYLNAEGAGAPPGEGNPWGRMLARQALRRLLERCHTRASGGGLFTMDILNPELVQDLVNTFDHFVLDDPAVAEVRRRRAADGPPGGAVPPAVWNRKPFPNDVPAVPVLRIPVALSELSYHDHPDDAALLSRAWFRRLAAEAIMIAIDNQLNDDPAVVSFTVLQRVLRNTFGDTPAVGALAAGAVSPATIQAAIIAVVDPSPAPVAPADASLGSLTTAVTNAARSFTRQQLVDTLRDHVLPRAGWEVGDAAADIAEFVVRPIVGDRPLDRPGDPPTRAEAGALACAAIGIAPATLANAEAQGVGDPPAPLLRAAPAPAGVRTTFLPRREANLLATRLDALRPIDVYKVADAWLADASWSPLDAPRGSRVFALDTGTPVVVVVQTAGVAWKTEHQTAANRLDDVEIHVEAAGSVRKLACTFRDGRLAVSDTWALDLPATPEPMDVMIELRVHLHGGAWQTVGSKKKINVRVLAAAVAPDPLPV